MNSGIKSLLFVPAMPSKIKKAFQYNADAIIFDLEDSIKKNSKKQALLDLIEALTKYENNDMKAIFVRVNSETMEFELEQLEKTGKIITGYVIPKTEGNWSLRNINGINKQITALIETPKGFVNLHEIAASDTVDAIAFGAEDYCSLTNMENREDFLLPLKIDIVKHARAFNKSCYDTISKEVKKTQKLEDDIRISKELGFDGKLAIHPIQVDIINNTFTILDVDKIKRIISKFEENDNGVLVDEGEIYERPHIELLKRKIGQADGNK